MIFCNAILLATKLNQRYALYSTSNYIEHNPINHKIASSVFLRDKKWKSSS